MKHGDFPVRYVSHYQNLPFFRVLVILQVVGGDESAQKPTMFNRFGNDYLSVQW